MAEITSPRERRSAESRSRAVDLFRHLDLDGDGVLNRDEVARALGVFHMEATAENLETIMTILDTNADGYVDMEDFVDAVAGIRTGHTDSEVHVLPPAFFS